MTRVQVEVEAFLFLGRPLLGVEVPVYQTWRKCGCYGVRGTQGIETTLEIKIGTEKGTAELKDTNL